MDEGARQTALDRHWEWDCLKYDRLAAMGLQRYTQGVPDITRVFRPGEIVAGCCLDSRMYAALHVGEKCGHVAGIASAGSLTRLPLERARDFAQKAGLTALYSHGGCGAAFLSYFEEFGKEPSSPGQLDCYCQNKTLKRAKQIGIPYGGHIPICTLRKSADIHPARSIAVVTTKAYSPYESEWLPRSFRVFWGYHHREDARKEVELALSIAFGPKGYAGRITRFDPLFLLVIADVDGEIGPGVIVQELEYMRSQLAPKDQDRVQIDVCSWSAKHQCIC